MNIGKPCDHPDEMKMIDSVFFCLVEFFIRFDRISPLLIGAKRKTDMRQRATQEQKIIESLSKPKAKN